METTKKQFEFFSGVVKILADVHATADTYDLWSKDGAGACVASANSNWGYRGYAGPVRACVVKALEAKGDGWKRTKTTKNDKDVYESADDFVKRLIKDGVTTAEEINQIANDALVAAGLTFQSTLASSSSRGEIGDSWLEAAQGVIEAWERGTNDAGQPASPELSLAKIRATLPNAVLNDASDVEEVARLLRDHDKALRKQSVV